MSQIFRLRVLPAIIMAALLAPNTPAFRLFQQSGAPNQQPPSQSPQQKSTPPQKNTPPAQDQDAVVRINTQLVQIDVVVTDKKEQHINDLNENDFELLVDGKPQSLSHFALIRVPPAKREAPAGPKADPKNEPVKPPSMPSKLVEPEKVKRTIAFVVDDLGLSFPSMFYARSAVKKFVDEQMQDGDLVGIIRTGRGLGALQQFTSDRRILYSAIERLTFNPQSRDMMAKFGADAKVAASEDDPAQQQTNDFDNFTDTSSSLGTLGALNFVVNGLRQLPGRKMVIFVSDGFNMYGTSGDDNQVVEELKYLADQANRASVVIYSLDAKGLQTLMPKADANLNDTTDEQLSQQVSDAGIQNLDSQAGMVFLAQETGGFARLNANDLDLGVQKIIQDNETYYLLGFDPEESQFDKRYHKIKVRVKKPGLQVRTRGGFYGISEAEVAPPPRTPNQQILAALASPFGARDIQVQMTSFFINSNARGSYVRSFFHFDCSGLTFKDGPDNGKTLTLDLATFAFNEEGQAVDQFASRLTFDLTEAQYKEAMIKGLVRIADVPIKKPGPYQFRAVLRDPSGKLGSTSQFIQVPDLTKKQLALSGLLISAPNPKSNAASNAPDPAIPADAQVNEVNQQLSRNDPQPTPAIRRFARNSEIQYAAWVFNAMADKKTKQPQLTTQMELYRNGKRVYQGQPHPVKILKGMNAQRIPCGGQIKVTEIFPPGDYLLRLIVTDNLANQKNARTDQWMDFSVMK